MMDRSTTVENFNMNHKNTNKPKNIQENVNDVASSLEDYKLRYFNLDIEYKDLINKLKDIKKKKKECLTCKVFQKKIKLLKTAGREIQSQLYKKIEYIKSISQELIVIIDKQTRLENENRILSDKVEQVKTQFWDIDKVYQLEERISFMKKLIEMQYAQLRLSMNKSCELCMESLDVIDDIFDEEIGDFKAFDVVDSKIFQKFIQIRHVLSWTVNCKNILVIENEELRKHVPAAILANLECTTNRDASTRIAKSSAISNEMIGKYYSSYTNMHQLRPKIKTENACCQTTGTWPLTVTGEIWHGVNESDKYIVNDDDMAFTNTNHFHESEINSFLNNLERQDITIIDLNDLLPLVSNVDLDMTYTTDNATSNVFTRNLAYSDLKIKQLYVTSPSNQFPSTIDLLMDNTDEYTNFVKLQNISSSNAEMLSESSSYPTNDLSNEILNTLSFCNMNSKHILPIYDGEVDIIPNKELTETFEDVSVRENPKAQTSNHETENGWFSPENGKLKCQITADQHGANFDNIDSILKRDRNNSNLDTESDSTKIKKCVPGTSNQNSPSICRIHPSTVDIKHKFICENNKSESFKCLNKAECENKINLQVEFVSDIHLVCQTISNKTGDLISNSNNEDDVLLKDAMLEPKFENYSDCLDFEPQSTIKMVCLDTPIWGNQSSKFDCQIADNDSSSPSLPKLKVATFQIDLDCVEKSPTSASLIIIESSEIISPLKPNKISCDDHDLRTSYDPLKFGIVSRKRSSTFETLCPTKISKPIIYMDLTNETEEVEDIILKLLEKEPDYLRQVGQNLISIESEAVGKTYIEEVIKFVKKHCCGKYRKSRLVQGIYYILISIFNKFRPLYKYYYKLMMLGFDVMDCQTVLIFIAINVSIFTAFKQPDLLIGFIVDMLQNDKIPISLIIKIVPLSMISSDKIIEKYEPIIFLLKHLVLFEFLTKEKSKNILKKMPISTQKFWLNGNNVFEVQSNVEVNSLRNAIHTSVHNLDSKYTNLNLDGISMAIEKRCPKL